MNYCVNLTRKGFKYLDEIAEITVDFRPSDTTLVDFMIQHQNQRINIAIVDEDDFVNNNRLKLFKAIREEHPKLNFVFKLNDIRGELTQQIYNQLKENDFKYFFKTLIKDWDMFWGFSHLHPTDMYIAEALGFEIQTVAEYAHEKDIHIRVFPNVAQSSWNNTTGIMKFFIRPEDIEVYEPYVDVMEFFGNDEKIAIYYKIYSKDKKWSGNLNEIILSLHQDIDSRCILPNFAERRLDCGKRCLKGGKCQTCAATLGLAQTLNKGGVTIKQLNKKLVKRKGQS